MEKPQPTFPALGSDATREQVLRRIRNLETLLRAGDELLEPALEPERRVLLTLRICLEVLTADAAVLVTRVAGRERARYLLRGEEELHTRENNPSGLSHEILETGAEGIRRESDSPGARAAADVLGGQPAVRVGVPLRRGERVLGALEVIYRTDPGERLDEDFSALRTLATHLSIVLDNARLVRESAQRAREMSHLYDIGTKISSHLDVDDLLDAILDAMVELIRANAAGIFLIDPDSGEIRNETLRGYDTDAMEKVHLKVGQGILGWVAKTGQGEIVPDVSADARYVQARAESRSQIAAPLKYEDRVLGVITLESDAAAAYDEGDLELLTAFANQAAISIANAGLHAEAKEKRHLDEQLEVAHDIQRSLLPRSAPEIPGHTLSGVNVPSSAIGGDYFDFLPLPDNRWAIVVADVSGHGVPAGLIMAGFRAEIRAGLRRVGDPRRMLSEINDLLLAELEPDRFVTAFLGIYSPDTGTLQYSNAGHEPGLLVRGGGRGVEELTEGGLLLGVFPGAQYGSAMVHLAPGDRLVLYTDGLSDAVDRWDGVLGQEGILRLFRELEEEGTSVVDLPAALLRRAEAEAASRPDEADDRTLVLLARHGEQDSQNPQEVATE